MSGPWEQYQSAPASEGPWSQYNDDNRKKAPAQETKRPLSQTLARTAANAYNEYNDFKKNLGAGLLRGAGSIGATLLTPVDAAARALGVQNDFIGRTDRRQAMDEGLRSMGADPNSLTYQGGKLGAEILGTSGVGGALAKGAEAVRAAPALVNALRTYGASAGASGPVRDIATRTAAGALTGGVSAGLVNPEDAQTGAMIGGSLPIALRTLGVLGDVGRNVIGGATGAGEKALKIAYESGAAGGDKARLFRENMRGTADIGQVVDDAEKSLLALREKNSAAYNANMAGVRADKTALDVKPVLQSVNSAIDDFTFKGEAKNESAYKALQKAKEKVSAWAAKDPAEFHTPEGLDALKQQIGGIIDELPDQERAARRAVKRVYDATKREIEAQAPAYGKAMKDYAQAADLVDQISGSLSVGKNAVDDTVLRKLQSALRNNVNTNFGLRTKALEELQEAGGRELMAPLAGQSLNNWTPRGVQMATAPSSAALAGLAGGPGAALTMGAISSPRLMGEAAYMAGKADPYIQALRRQLYQTAPVIAAD